MKRLIIAVVFILTLAAMPMGVMAATRTNTTTKPRADGGTIVTTVITKVTWEDKGSNRQLKTTVVTTIVEEKAADGFVESRNTTTETTKEETTTSTETNTSKKTKKNSKSYKVYADVIEKKVGDEVYEAIKDLKAHGAFRGVVKGKKFYPNRKITRREYSRVLRNLYGRYAPVSNSGAKATEKWARAQLVRMSEKMGMKIKWNGRNRKITRAEAAKFIKIFADYDTAFALR